LPYRIRPSDVKAVVDRDAVFEIPLSPALLHLKYRKGLIQACRELQSACVGLMKSVRVIVSSGDRSLDNADVGSLAFRTPGDVVNLCRTVLQFDDAISSHALTEFPIHVLQRGERRRDGLPSHHLHRPRRRQDVVVQRVAVVTKQELLSNLRNNKDSKSDDQADPVSTGKEDSIDKEIEEEEQQQDIGGDGAAPGDLSQVDNNDTSKEGEDHDDDDNDVVDEGFIAM
jgi:hypothetical protein